MLDPGQRKILQLADNYLQAIDARAFVDKMHNRLIAFATQGTLFSFKNLNQNKSEDSAKNAYEIFMCR